MGRTVEFMVACAECHHVWWVVAEVTSPGDLFRLARPECPRCFGPGIATGARTDDGERRAFGLRRGAGARNPKSERRRAR